MSFLVALLIILLGASLLLNYLLHARNAILEVEHKEMQQQVKSLICKYEGDCCDESCGNEGED